jgi:hypothetical protein
MFRFTIRDVLWLTALVALAVGWFMEHGKLERTAGQLEASDHQVNVHVGLARTYEELLDAKISNWREDWAKEIAARNWPVEPTWARNESRGNHP